MKTVKFSNAKNKKVLLSKSAYFRPSDVLYTGGQTETLKADAVKLHNAGIQCCYDKKTLYVESGQTHPANQILGI